MRIPVPTKPARLDFEGVGRTLRLLDGDRVRVGLAYVPAGERGVASLLGGTVGQLRVPLAEHALPDSPSVDLPATTFQAGERAYLLEIDETAIAISDADFGGASYDGGVLTLQVGPLLISVTAEHGDGA